LNLIESNESILLNLIVNNYIKLVLQVIESNRIERIYQTCVTSFLGSFTTTKKTTVTREEEKINYLKNKMHFYLFILIPFSKGNTHLVIYVS